MPRPVRSRDVLSQLKLSLIAQPPRLRRQPSRLAGDEHLELRRINWDEYAMFSWLCTKADPRSGVVRTSWPTISEQTGLTPNHVEKLCRGLRNKGYVAYPTHQGKRRLLVELAINKFPLADGSYTAIGRRRDASGAEVRAEVPAEVAAEVPAQLGGQKLEESSISVGGRNRSRKRKRSRIHPSGPLCGRGSRFGQSQARATPRAAHARARARGGGTPWNAPLRRS